MVWYIYLHLVDFLVNVGKYNRTPVIWVVGISLPPFLKLWLPRFDIYKIRRILINLVKIVGHFVQIDHENVHSNVIRFLELGMIVEEFTPIGGLSDMSKCSRKMSVPIFFGSDVTHHWMIYIWCMLTSILIALFHWKKWCKRQHIRSPITHFAGFLGQNPRTPNPNRWLLASVCWSRKKNNKPNKRQTTTSWANMCYHRMTIFTIVWRSLLLSRPKRNDAFTFYQFHKFGSSFFCGRS